MTAGTSPSHMFSREGQTFLPAAVTRGYWTEDSIDGRAIVSLLGHEIERRHGRDDLVPTRLTVDMHRLARRDAMEIVTTVIRDGARLRLVEARLMIADREYARATCQFLRPAEPPPGKVWPGIPPWNVPAPDALETLPDNHGRRLADWRVIAGAMREYGPRQLWIRTTSTIVADEPLTPFTRAAAVADVTSPWVHGSDAGIGYINSDITMQLHRLPQGEWVGFETVLQDASHGLAVGSCRLYDEAGSVGLVITTALANTRR